MTSWLLAVSLLASSLSGANALQGGAELERDAIQQEGALSRAMAKLQEARWKSLPRASRPQIPGQDSPGIHRARLLSRIESRIRLLPGTSTKTRERTVPIVHEMLSRTPVQVLEMLAACQGSAVVNGPSYPVEDMAEFSFLRERAEMTRDYYAAPFVGGITIGLSLDAKKEDTFVAMIKEDHISAGVVVHEYSHVIHLCALASGDPRRFGRIASLYRERVAAGTGFADGYSSRNEREYFAQAVALWFGTIQADSIREPFSDKAAQRNADWMQTADPQMHDLLLTSFGPPRYIPW